MEVALNNSLAVKFRKINSYESFLVLDGCTERNVFSETWNGVAFNIGLRNKLSEFELKEIFNFVSTYFQKLNLSDIREAFGLYSANKLSFMVNGKRQTTVGHFQSFDNVFIGAILKSYTDYSNYENQIKSMETVDIKKEIATSENSKESFDMIEGCYKGGKEPWIANWNFAFKYMESEKIIEYSNEEKEMFMENVLEDLKEDRLTLKHKRKDTSDISRIINTKSKLADECRKRLVKKYFESKYETKS